MTPLVDPGCRCTNTLSVVLLGPVIALAPANSVLRTARPLTPACRVSRYDISHVEIHTSARKHGLADEDISHAVEHSLAAGEHDDGQVLYLGPDRAANLLEVVSVVRDDGTEIVIHAMRMRAKYEPFLRGEGDIDV